jgi:hypothetical protein
MKHQLEAPRPVEVVRSDVPLALLAVLARAMAKKPAERYQTPRDLAAALLAVNDTSPPVAAVPLEAVPAPAPEAGRARRSAWVFTAWLGGLSVAALLALVLLALLLVR